MVVIVIAIVIVFFDYDHDNDYDYDFFPAESGKKLSVYYLTFITEGVVK